MNLLDLFENPLPPGVKLSDIPPAMRQKLTMRDVEKERPAGAFRFRVMFPDGTHSDFMDFQRAKQAADLEKGRVVKLSEVKKKLSEQSQNPLAQGIANFYLIAKKANTDEPVTIMLDGRPAKVMSMYTKRAIVKAYQQELAKDAQARRAAPSKPADLFGEPEQPQQPRPYGRFQEEFLRKMATQEGYEEILAPWEELIKKHKDFAQHGGSIPGERGYQEKLPQDYDFGDDEITEADIKDQSARTQRMITRLRQAHPQAKSDAEALAYAFVDAQRRDQEAIDKLEKELDGVEKDVQGDLRKQISDLRARREKTQRRGQERSAADDRQDALLKRLDSINKMQDAAIDELEKEINQIERTPAKAQSQPKSRPQAAPAPAQQKRPAARPVSDVSLAEPVSDIDPETVAQSSSNEPDLFGQQQQMAAESLRPGEYHNAKVTFDDGSKETVKITTDEGFRDMIKQHFAKQGRKVVDIDVDYSVRSVNEAEKKPKPTNPQLWGRAKAAAKSKFDVYPSAYANAWAAKWYKQHGGGWR